MESIPFSAPSGALNSGLMKRMQVSFSAVVLSILNHLPWKGEFKIFPAACLYCSYITFTLTSIKYISYFYKTVLRNFSFLGCNQAWKCTTLLFSSTVNTSNIKHLFNLVSLVVHSIYLAFPFSLGIQGVRATGF